MSLVRLHVDRFATLYVARPLFAVTNKSEKALPALMYHSVSDTDEGSTAPYYRTCTCPDRFRAQMFWLAENGYRTVGIHRAQEMLRTGEDVSKSVIITFDDGFRDFYTEAFPTLKKWGLTATMYLPTAYIADERKSFKGRECLTWTEVKELRSCGMEFGSHTVNHPELVKLGWPQIERELCESKEMIEQRLQETVTGFAYPYAFPQTKLAFTEKLSDLLRSAGYQSCVTTEIGRISNADQPLRWKRLPMNSCDDAELLEAKLTGKYDWLGSLQSFVKRVKAV